MIGNKGIFGITKGPGYNVINKFGVNLDIDTGSTPETIWAHGGVFPFIDAGIAMDIVSSSANDTLEGTGAQKIRVTFYQADNTEIIQDFDMDGVTPVQINDDIKICTRIEVIQTGAGMSNAGEINLVDRATGLVVYQSVEIGEGQTLSAIQICPKNKKGLVRKHTVTYAKEQNPLGSADIRFNIRKSNGSILVKHSTVISAIKDFDKVKYDVGGIEMSEGDIFYCECIAVTAADTPIEARFDIEFQDS
jgi:hypothetical protein